MNDSSKETGLSSFQKVVTDWAVKNMPSEFHGLAGIVDGVVSQAGKPTETKTEPITLNDVNCETCGVQAIAAVWKHNGKVFGWCGNHSPSITVQADDDDPESLSKDVGDWFQSVVFRPRDKVEENQDPLWHIVMATNGVDILSETGDVVVRRVAPALAARLVEVHNGQMRMREKARQAPENKFWTWWQDGIHWYIGPKDTKEIVGVFDYDSSHVARKVATAHNESMKEMAA